MLRDELLLHGAPHHLQQAALLAQVLLHRTVQAVQGLADCIYILFITNIYFLNSNNWSFFGVLLEGTLWNKHLAALIDYYLFLYLLKFQKYLSIYGLILE